MTSDRTTRRKGGPLHDTTIRTYSRPQDAREQGQQTDATHQRVQFIRDNMEMSVSELQEYTELPRPLIATIKVSEMNDNYKKRDIDNNRSLFDQLTPEMKDWLRDNEKGSSWWKYGDKFNERFSDQEVTPLYQQTVKKYYKRLKSPAKLTKTGEK